MSQGARRGRPTTRPPVPACRFARLQTLSEREIYSGTCIPDIIHYVVLARLWAKLDPPTCSETAMSKPFLPSAATAETAFGETELGAAMAPHPGMTGAGTALAMTLPRATQRQQRLDVTNRRPWPGSTIDMEGVRENLRSRLLGVVASLAWKDRRRQCDVLTGLTANPEFTEGVRQRLIAQLGIARRFVRPGAQCETVRLLAQDFRDWFVEGYREDGGLWFESNGADIYAIAPATAPIPQ